MSWPVQKSAGLATRILCTRGASLVRPYQTSSIYAIAVSNYLLSSHKVAAAAVSRNTMAFTVAAGVFFAGAFIAATV